MVVAIGHDGYVRWFAAGWYERHVTVALLRAEMRRWRTPGQARMRCCNVTDQRDARPASFRARRKLLLHFCRAGAPMPRRPWMAGSGRHTVHPWTSPAIAPALPAYRPSMDIKKTRCAFAHRVFIHRQGGAGSGQTTATTQSLYQRRSIENTPRHPSATHTPPRFQPHERPSMQGESES